MAIEAELADGRILEFPDGTDPKVIQNTVKKLMGTAEPKLGDYLKDIPKAVGRGATGLLETSAIGASALLPEEYEQAARKGISSLAEPAKQYLAPSSQEIGESVSSKLASGVGSTLPFFALGPAGLLGRVAGAGLGVAAGAGEARQGAEAKGATPEERRLATQLGAPTGLLDILAPEVTLFKGIIGNALARGGVEGATEAAQKIAQNLIAKGVYDPKQDVLAGSGEEGAYGAGVGALASLIIDMTLGRKGRAPANINPAAQAAAPEQAPPEQPVPQAPTGGLSAERAAELRAEADAEAAAKAPKLALEMNQPFTPVALPDGSVALTKQDLDNYEREQFEKQYAPQPNLNQAVPAATPPQLGYSPLPGVPKVSTSGNVALTPDQELQAQYAPQPVRVTQEEWNAMPPEKQAEVQAAAQEAAMPPAPEFVEATAPQKLEKGQKNYPVSEKQLADEAEMKKQLAEVKKEISSNKKTKTDLFHALKGKLHTSDMQYFGPPGKSRGKFRFLSGGDRGAHLEDLISDRQINDYLPPSLHIDGTEDYAEKDAKVEKAKEYLLNALATGDTASFEEKENLRVLNEQKDSLTDLINQPKQMREASLEAGRVAEEQAGTEPIPTDDLLNVAKSYGIDTDAVAEDVAKATQGMTDEQYRGEYRNELERQIRTAKNDSNTLFSLNKESKPKKATAAELKMQKDLENKSMVQAAQYLITNAPNAFQKFVAKKVLNVIKEMEARGVEFQFEVQSGNVRNTGLYDGQGLTTHFFNKEGKPLRIQVLLNGAPVFEKQRGYPSGLSYKTLMHELLHVATSTKVWYLADTHPAVKELNDLYKLVAEEYKKQRANGTLPDFLKDFNNNRNNSLENPNEMLSWSMTDEHMQKWMSDIKVGDKTVFSKIVDLIRQVLGMPKPFETALDRLVRTTDSLLDMDVQVLEDGMIAKGRPFGGTKQPTKKMPTQQQTLFSKRAQEMFNKLQTGKADITNTPAFKRWFGKSKIVNEDGSPKVMYHGSRREFESPTTRGNRNAFFVSPDANFASKYALNDLSWFPEKTGTITKGEEGAQIYPVYISAQNPFDYDNSQHLKKIIPQFRKVLKEEEGLGREAIQEMVDMFQKGTWRAIELANDYDLFEKNGFDAFYASEQGRKNLGVFEPTQVKSVFNEGAFSSEDVRINKLQFGKKAEPTPTGNGQASLDNLTAMGRVVAAPEPSYLAKVRESWDNARDNPKATADAARTSFQRFRDRIETWAFSSDAALNNTIRREVMASTAGQEEKIGLMLNASLSQTVHSDAVASLFLQKGGITYDKSLHKWVGKETDDNFVTLSKQLDAIAEKNGLTKPQIELIAHAAFEAKRTKSLIGFNNELAAKIATIQAEAASKRKSSPVAASALSEKAQRMKEEFKYIHLDDAEIAAGMKFFQIHPELNEVVKTWNRIRDNAADVLVESGLWSRGDAEFLLSNADYVPFYREDQLEQGQGPKEFIRGLKVQAKERKLKGSDKPVNDIFDNQVRWVQYSINRAVRNRSAIALADTAVSVGAAKQVQSSKDGANVTRIWRDGKEEFYDMADPMFMEAFNGLEAVVIPSWKWASTLANTLRQSVVMYPLFSVAQVPQDSFAAMFSSGLKPQYALRIPILAVKEFIQTLRGKSKSHEELKNIGAVGVRDFTSAMVREDAEIFSGLKAPPGLLGKLKYGLNHIAMAADNAVRQAVFEAAEAQGLSKAEAFEKAFEVFNVRRKGSSKTMALASQLIPFFNAYLAAQNVAYKTITGRGISPEDRVNALQTLTATTASVMTLSLLYAMLNGDDDDYLKKPAVQRDRLLMIPGTGGMSIPLRSDLFTMPKIITEHMYLLMTDKGYEDGRKFRESITNALGNSLLGPTAVPQAIKPIVEVAINHDFFQGRPLVGTYQKKLETERQFTDSTSEMAKFIGSSGLISPIAVDHLIRGMFGSVGGLTLYMTSAMLDSNPEAPRPSLSLQDAIATLPGMSGFVAKTYENSLKRDFYSLKEEVDRSVNTFNDLKKRSPEEIPEFLAKQENMQRLGLQKSVNKVADNLSKIRDSISRITNANMPADEKQRQIQILRQVEINMLKGVNVKQLREFGMI